MGMIWYDSIHWYSIISSFIKIIHLSQVESGLLLVGDSSGLVRALPLGSLEATRGHDEKRCGDGVRLRSCVRSWNCKLAICQVWFFMEKAGRWSNFLWNIFSWMEIISSHYQSLLEISLALTLFPSVFPKNKFQYRFLSGFPVETAQSGSFKPFVSPISNVWNVWAVATSTGRCPDGEWKEVAERLLTLGCLQSILLHCNQCIRMIAMDLVYQMSF